MFDALRDALRNFLSANELLDADLPTCKTSRINGKSSISSQSNQRFYSDPLLFKKFDPGHKLLGDALSTLWDKFKTEMDNVPDKFYDITFSKMLHLEGDVADICLVNILLPVALVMNAFLKMKHPQGNRYEIVIQAQYRKMNEMVGNQEHHYVDHCLVFKGPTWDLPLVIFEEKGP